MGNQLDTSTFSTPEKMGVWCFLLCPSFILLVLVSALKKEGSQCTLSPYRVASTYYRGGGSAAARALLGRVGPSPSIDPLTEKLDM